jgi:hypothetical protein
MYYTEEEGEAQSYTETKNGFSDSVDLCELSVYLCVIF